MGGWITQTGETSDFKVRLARFEKIFSVDQVPHLRTEIHIHSNRAKTILWAWNQFLIPDIYVEDTDTKVSIILCGAVTNLGHFGPLPENHKATASMVLKLWIKHRDNLIKELNGSFSCLFYEANRNEATLYTDRFASRSIWFTKENGVWIIGNFPSAINAIKKNNPKIDPVGLWSLFNTGRHVGKHGLYHNTHCLLAAEKAILPSASQATVSKWEQRKYTPDRSIKPREWGDRIAKALQQSSQRYKKVCSQPYIFLSGGLDSRIAAAAFGKPLKSITLSAVPNTETRIASVVSKIAGLEHKRIIQSPYWSLNTLDAAALISSGNHLTCHTHFIVPTCEIASQNPNVEFFLGDLLENFNKHYFLSTPGYNLSYKPENMMEILHSYVHYSLKDTQRLGVHFRKEIRSSLEKIYKEALESYAMSLMDVSDDDADKLDTFLRWADISVTPTFNMITCLRPLACERNICLDNEVNQISLEIPSKLRGAGKLHKWTLYHLNKILTFIPYSNTFLPPVFPNSIGSFIVKARPTLGKIRRSFVIKSRNLPVLKTSGPWVSMQEMYRKDSRYKGKIEEIINDSIFPGDIFDISRIRKTWEEYIAGNINLHSEIDAILSFGTLNKLLPCSGIKF
jgi:hypothetical protein